MAMQATLDTHRMVKRLRDSGFTESQAETVTDVLRESREADLSTLATKADIDALRREIAELRKDLETQGQELRKEIADQGQELRKEIADLRKDMRLLEQDLRTEIADQGQDLRKEIADFRKDMRLLEQDLRKEMQLLEQRLTIKLGSMMVVAVGVVAALVRLL